LRQVPALFLLVVLVAILPVVVCAQDTEAPADTTIVEEEPTDLMRAQELLGTLTAELDTLTSFVQQAKKAEDEQFKLLRVSARRHIEIIEDNQPILLKLVTELNPEDPEDPVNPEAAEVKEGAARFLIAKFDIYDQSIEWWAREIDQHRDQRSVTPPEDLDDLEAQIGIARDQLDKLLVALEKILNDADTLGVDTKRSWEQFDRAINNRAENLVGRLQISVDGRESLKKKIQSSEKAGAPEAEIGADRTRLQHAEERVKGVAQSLDATVNLLGSRGFETAPYRQFVIRTTGEIITGDKIKWVFYCS
jgi:hypothetical protein